MKQIKFIHCADLHLDSPFIGLKLPTNIYEKTKQSTFLSFTKIIDAAIEEKVDFMIIAGDVYDGEDRSIRAQLYFREEMERLQKENIPVFLIHGNHDHLGGSWTSLQWPENVFTFPATVKMIPYTTSAGVCIHLYGFSFPKKHVYERMIQHYKKIDGADYHIGILHGHDSNNASHYSYAPFKLRELIEKDFDYWALGHIHKTEILHKEPMIMYPGNTQGRHKKESGEKGCYLIEMDGFETKAKFIETAPIRWETWQFSNEKMFQSFDELYGEIVELKEFWRKKQVNVFLQIEIREASVAETVRHWLRSEEFLSLLQEGEEQLEPFVWIYHVKVQEEKQSTNEIVSDDFYYEINKQINELTNLQLPLAQLFDHPRAKKFLDSLTVEEQLEIKNEAKKVVNRLLEN